MSRLGFLLVASLLVMLAVPDIVLWLPTRLGYTPGEDGGDCSASCLRCLRAYPGLREFTPICNVVELKVGSIGRRKTGITSK